MGIKRKYAEMVLLSLPQRTKRKYERDGLRSLMSEGLYLLAESKSVRTFIGRKLIERNDVNVLGYEQLHSMGSSWLTFNESELSPITEPIPAKKRIPASREFEQTPTSSPQPPSVIELPDCTLIHPFGLTLCNRGILQETIASSTSSSSRIEKALSKSVLDHSYREIDSLISGRQPNSLESLSLATPLMLLWRNYYHWTLECLPRLAGAERYQTETGNEPTIIVPENLSSWMLESLELLGIDDNRIHQLDTHCTVDRLVVPTHPGPTPAECKWVRDQMRAAIDGPATNEESTGNRIYISRQNATRRRVKNEAEVVDMLRSHGFEQYVLEELSVAEQVNLFANADIVVAPHGAGLANIVYSESVTIIELFGDTKKTTFYRLAELLDHEYHYLHNSTYYNDLVIDIGQLKNALTKMN